MRVIDRRVEWINYGGCGVFAVELYQWLEAHGYKPKLVVLSRNGDIMNDQITNNKSTCHSLSHVIVQLGEYYIDSEGAYNRWEVENKWDERDWTENVPFFIIKMWNQYESNWNSQFDRGEIPTIQKFFKTLSYGRQSSNQVPLFS